MPGAKTKIANDTQQNLVSFDQEKLVKSLNEWRAEKSIGGAADLLNFAHISTALPLLFEPAEYLVSLKEPISPVLKKVSSHFLKAGVFSNDVEISTTDLRPIIWYYHQASQLKKNIVINPRDAVALVDLARIYTALGQKDKAKKAILIAINLYPNHPFALRSAARFFIQNDEAEVALHLINSSPRTLHDPWLLASKLSIEEILGRQHRQLGTARSIVEAERISPYQLSELRGSIASILLTSGDIKQAKRMFNKALINPNDNVVAQALWASQKYGITINVRDDWLSDPLSSEALYYQRCLEGDFDSAKDAAISWFVDEPFSPRPLRAATFALAILGEAKLSEQYALYGLLLDRDDTELRNNLVCALALQDKIDEAVEQLQRVIHIERSQSNELSGHTMANIGMILYREGNFQEAEECYRKALDSFSNKSSDEAKSIAISFMAREAAFMNAPNALKLITEAIDMVKKTKSKAGEQILKLIDKVSSIDKIIISDKSIKNPKWAFDKNRNIIIVKKLLPFS
ncbi:MAG: tetratricopeptide repeat protein [Gallionella sp.]|nr:tetratricopeptide repeat protein [Gallionella sp.]